MSGSPVLPVTNKVLQHPHLIMGWHKGFSDQAMSLVGRGSIKGRLNRIPSSSKRPQQLWCPPAYRSVSTGSFKRPATWVLDLTTLHLLWDSIVQSA